MGINLAVQVPPPEPFDEYDARVFVDVDMSHDENPNYVPARLVRGCGDKEHFWVKFTVSRLDEYGIDADNLDRKSQKSNDGVVIHVRTHRENMRVAEDRYDVRNLGEKFNRVTEADEDEKLG